MSLLDNDTDYNKWKVDDLKAELKKQGISFSKNARKTDLVDLLSKKEEK
jgi:lambda repressor-like predicted transcriptional regulator